MKELTSCKTAMENCINEKYFAIAHLYKEEKAMKVHIHDCYEVYYSISGGKQFLIDNQLYTISSGDIFVINQYESHYLTQIDKEIHERIVLSIHPDYLRKISTDETDLSYCFTSRPSFFQHKLSFTKEQQQRFLYYINKITSANGFGHDILEQVSFTELMLFLTECYLEHAKEIPMKAPVRIHDQRVDDILSYINQNISESFTIEDLAKNFYLSESYICRTFKAATGMTINKYVTARRISIAKSLLATGSTVNNACIQSGYNDYTNFVRSFTKTVGISPKKYAQLSSAL